MTEQAATTSSGRSPLLRWLIGLGIALLVFVGMAIFSWVIIASFGRVAGVEFSPERFERRSFIYFEIPLVHVQVWPIYRKSETGSFETYLVGNNFISIDRTAKANWDLVFDNRHHPSSALCDARILCAYFDTFTSDGALAWQQWTDDNPKLAKKLWPAVAEAARARCYIFIPDLVDVARRADDAVQLQQQLDKTLADKYRLAAENEQNNDRHERAVALFTLALNHDPADVDALRGRAKSHEEQGRDEKAAADLAEAKKLDTK